MPVYAHAVTKELELISRGVCYATTVGPREGDASPEWANVKDSYTYTGQYCHNILTAL